MTTTADQTKLVTAFEIDTLCPSQNAHWDAFVASHPKGSLYHQSIWRDLIKDLFGHESLYLCARGASKTIVGVLPAIRLNSRLFGDFMVSMPYVNYGGAIASNPQVEEALMREAGVRAKDLGCEHIEFRDTSRRDSNWQVRADKVAMELLLPESTRSLWSVLGSKVRAQIKRPQKEGFTVVHGQIDMLPYFYQVFAHNMRDLGTPVYPQTFFSSILEAFPQSSSLIIVQHNGQPVASGFLLGDRERLQIPWASSIRTYNRLGVNMLLYWEALKQAIENDYRIFDFGRSSVNSGTYRFKKQWGAQENQLYWHYWLNGAQQIPQLTPDNSRYRAAITIWKHLPLSLTKWLGPQIVKYLP